MASLQKYQVDQEVTKINSTINGYFCYDKFVCYHPQRYKKNSKLIQCTHAQRAPHFFAITLGLLKIKNNSLISRGGKGSQLCLQHNEHTTAVFTSFVLITFCHFFATPSPTLTKIYELYQSGNPKGARWAYLARSGNQSEPRASDCPRAPPAL